LWEILQPSGGMIVALSAVMAYATYLAAIDEEGFDNALALVLLTQLLAASTGYRDRLIRGHFDALLAGRDRRHTVAFAHAGLSMLPGLALWLAFGVASHAVGRPSLALTSGGLLAFTYASSLVWVVSLWLGRNTGGVLWLAALFALAFAGKITVLKDTYRTVSADWIVTLKSAGAALVVPIAMLGNGGYVEPTVRALVSLGIMAALAAGVWTIVWLDAPLRDPS
jgi:hypothetical protein